MTETLNTIQALNSKLRCEVLLSIADGANTVIAVTALLDHSPAKIKSAVITLALSNLIEQHKTDTYTLSDRGRRAVALLVDGDVPQVPNHSTPATSLGVHRGGFIPSTAGGKQRLGEARGKRRNEFFDGAGKPLKAFGEEPE